MKTSSNLSSTHKNNNNSSSMTATGSSSDYSLPGVLYFLQTEWRRFEQERYMWKIEKEEYLLKIAKLEGEIKGMNTVKSDMLRRIKMLEYALKEERKKNEQNNDSERIDDDSNQRVWRDSNSATIKNEMNESKKKNEKNDPPQYNDNTTTTNSENSKQDTTKVNANTLFRKLNSKRSKEILKCYIEEVSSLLEITSTNLETIPEPNFNSSSPFSGVKLMEVTATNSFADGSSKNVSMVSDSVLSKMEMPFTSSLTYPKYSIRASEPSSESAVLERRPSITFNDDSNGSRHTKYKNSSSPKYSNIPVDANVKRRRNSQSESSDYTGENDSSSSSKNTNTTSKHRLEKLLAYEAVWLNANKNTESTENLAVSESDTEVASDTSQDDVADDLENFDQTFELPTTHTTVFSDPCSSSSSKRQQNSQSIGKWTVKQTIRCHLDSIRCIAFHPNKALLLSASDDFTVKLWDFNSDNSTKHRGHDMEPTLILRGHQTSVLSVSFSTDGLYAFSGDLDSCICMWDIQTLLATCGDNFSSLKPIYKFVGHSDAVWCIKAHPKEHQFASSSADGTVKIWIADLKNSLYSLSCNLTHPESSVPVQLCWIENKDDGTKEPRFLLAVCYENRDILIFDPIDSSITKKIQVQYSSHFDTIQEEGEPSETESKDKKDKEMENDTTNTNSQVVPSLNAITYCSELNYLIVGDESADMSIYDASTGDFVVQFRAHTESISSLDVSGTILLSGGHDCSMRWWDLKEKNKCIHEYSALRKKFDEGICSVQIHPLQQDYLSVSAAADGSIKVLVKNSS